MRSSRRYRRDMTLEKYRRATEWPLAALALAFVAAYAYDVIGHLRSPADTVPEVVMNIVWGVFVIDYLVSLVLAPDRRRWFLTHLHELVIVVLPVLRPLRLLRLLPVVLLLHRGALWAFRGRVVVFLVGSTLLLVFVAGIAVLDAEQDAHGANLKQIGDAWWWAFATITTVGYGDFYPITFAGRLVAVGLMACGVGLLGSVTALLASWFVEQVNRARDVATQAVVSAVDAAVAEIEGELQDSDPGIRASARRRVDPGDRADATGVGVDRADRTGGRPPAQQP